MHQNVCAERNGEGIEVDLLVVNDSDVIAIECKGNLGIDDVKEHLLRLAKLKRLLPGYANKRVMGAVTGMVLPERRPVCVSAGLVCDCADGQPFGGAE